MKKQCKGIAVRALLFTSLILRPAFASDLLVSASRTFSIPNHKYVPRDIALSRDGTSLCAVSVGFDTTFFFAWDITNGKAIGRGKICFDPIPHKGGCIVGDPGSANHPPISQATWESPDSPVFVWNIGQEIDFKGSTQTAILQHPGWDAWESYSIVPGWSLSKLEVRSLNSTSSQPIAHWVEWNPPQNFQPNPLIKSYFLRRMVWSGFIHRSIECLSRDGKWIALASPADPDFEAKDINAIFSGLTSIVRLRMWSVGWPTAARSLPLQKPPVMIELSPHGNYLVTRDKNEICDVIETSNGIQVGTLGKHASWIYWSDNEEHLYIVNGSTRTISRYQVNPFQLDVAFRLSCTNERGFESIIVDPDHDKAVGWFWERPDEDVMATAIQLFDLRRLGQAPAPNPQGKLMP